MRTRISKRTRPRIPAIPGKSRSTKEAEAYERLGVTKEDVDKLPKITHIIKKSFPKHIDQAIEYLRGADNDEARKWLKVYDEIPASARKLLPFEAYCLAANIPTKRMLGIIIESCSEQEDHATALLSKAAKPKILQAAVKNATGKSKEALEDRKMILQHEGYAPMPKTQVINMTNSSIYEDSRNQTANISIGELAGFDKKMALIENKMSERMGLVGEVEVDGKVKSITGGLRDDRLIEAGSDEVEDDSGTVADVDNDPDMVEDADKGIHAVDSNDGGGVSGCVRDVLPDGSVVGDDIDDDEPEWEF